VGTFFETPCILCLSNAAVNVSLSVAMLLFRDILTLYLCETEQIKMMMLMMIGCFFTYAVIFKWFRILLCQ